MSSLRKSETKYMCLKSIRQRERRPKASGTAGEASSSKSISQIDEPQQVSIEIFPASDVYVRDELSGRKGTLQNLAKSLDGGSQITINGFNHSAIDSYSQWNCSYFISVLHEEDEDLDAASIMTGVRLPRLDQKTLSDAGVPVYVSFRSGRSLRPSSPAESQMLNPLPPRPSLKSGDDTACVVAQPIIDEIASGLRQWHIFFFNTLPDVITVSFRSDNQYAADCVVRLVKGNPGVKPHCSYPYSLHRLVTFRPSSAYFGSVTRKRKKSIGNTVVPGDNRFRRPFGCAVLELAQLAQMWADDLDVLYQNIMNNNTKEFEKDEMLVVSVKVYRSDATTIIKENTSVLQDTPHTLRLGFPDVVFPGEVRNELYIKLWSGSFEVIPNHSSRIIVSNLRGKPSAMNMHVTIEVRDEKGRTMEGAISKGSG
ncbi:hypothetical protein F5877DRAFT_80663 [Lentinula edodes]|nr:hypothetical protein F5877DRAFT_80663 [Lentinula edodes]